MGVEREGGGLEEEEEDDDEVGGGLGGGGRMRTRTWEGFGASMNTQRGRNYLPIRLSASGFGQKSQSQQLHFTS